MDLIDLMTTGVNPEDAALDRLEAILARFEAEDPEVQDEALARARDYCDLHWGGYQSGLAALADRIEARAADPLAGSLAGLRWRQEGEDSGSTIRAVRRRRDAAGRQDAARAALIERYGSEEAARGPTPLERVFVTAAADLTAAGDVGDPFAPLSGWSLPWHPLPEDLRQAVAAAQRLPVSIVEAREECLAWEGRRDELALLGEGPGSAALPTACAARHRIVEELWRKDLPASDPADLLARLEYWRARGGDDGLGYQVVLADLGRLIDGGSLTRSGGGTGDIARALKAEHPDWSLAMIGKHLGISRQAVHKHLKR